MDYESAYKQALERAKSMMALPDDKAMIEEIFPELKESEDEKVCKEIKQFIRSRGMQLAQSKVESWIAWLEKQYEHARFREVIQVGDHVTKNEDGVLVNLSQLKRVAKKDEKQGEQKPYGQRDECLDCQFNYAGECKGFCAMKRGEQKPTENEPCEPWSGEQTRRNLIMYIKDSYKKEHPLPYSWRYIKWLENQKEATNFAELMNKLSAKEQEAMFNAWPKEQKPAKWNEEDKRIWDIVWDMIDGKFAVSESAEKEAKDWFISLKDRFVSQSKQEWSEEDMYNLDNIIWLCDNCMKNIESTWIPSQASKIKSLIERIKENIILQPQNTWKPSEEQMKALNEVINFAADHGSMHWNDFIYHVLISIREQLKKL